MRIEKEEKIRRDEQIRIEKQKEKEKRNKTEENQIKEREQAITKKIIYTKNVKKYTREDKPDTNISSSSKNKTTTTTTTNIKTIKVDEEKKINMSDYILKKDCQKNLEEMKLKWWKIIKFKKS